MSTLAPSNVPVVDIDPFSTEFLTDPYAAHQQMREAGPVVYLPKYEIYAMARHAEVHAVLGDWETFISSAGVGLANFRKETPFRPQSLILEADPPQHTKSRTVLSRVLSPKSVMALRTSFQAEAVALAERLLARCEIDAVKEIGEAYPLKVFPDAVGLTSDGRENLLAYGDMIFNAFGPRNELFANAVKRVGPTTQWIMANCQRAALRPGGLGDQIYQAVDSGELTEDEAPMLVRSFLSAGVDTTVNGIGNALYCLAQFPEQWAKLHANPALARPAFEEALRYESAVQTFFRTSSRDAEVGGVQITEGCKVLTFLGAANRDPCQWPNADVFDIERRPSGHMAFGSGIHGCVGQMVARLEGELVLGELAKRFKRIEITAPPTRRLNNTLRALGSLPLRLIPA
ncbi:cytochrome P450 [Polaromonas sp.]|uniref:cytochrome P450 n=1 Tax=Polaromonas sp. TaxID=1869339 RepID=UPI003569E3FE